MNKKGFTLIELLAVILILGIIALIAIPTVNSIITESKVGSMKSTANNIVTAYERYAQLQDLRGADKIMDFNGQTGDVIKTQIDLKGDVPDTIEVLMLNSNGDALIKFTTDGIQCWNYGNDASASDQSTYPEDVPTTNHKPISMVCDKEKAN